MKSTPQFPAWQPIGSLILDNRQVWFHCPLGGLFEAPATTPYEPTRKEQFEMYKAGGDWPNVGWDATHWMEIDRENVPLEAPE